MRSPISAWLNINWIILLSQKADTANCPKMMEVGEQRISHGPFQVSRYKRGGIPWFNGLNVHPLIMMLHPDRKFNWTPIREDKGVVPKKNDVSMANTRPNSQRILTISKELMIKLGWKVLRNQAICFAGRPLDGIRMPRHASLRPLLLRNLFIWYLPCVEVHGNTFKLNKECFAAREYTFLRIFYHAKTMYTMY